MAKQRDHENRDDLISRARFGEVNPDEAEAKAKANGWPPFASEPPLPEFDPLKQSRWPIVMAVAWIAWRDVELTRQQCAEFRAESTHWIFREWRQPLKGKGFADRAGWFLERLSSPTTARLMLHDIYRRNRDEFSSSQQMSAREAEAILWQALSDGKLIAEGLNEQSKPVDIPAREWSYLKLFEERERDVLKYEALDREVFSSVRLKRDNILTLWPQLPTTIELVEQEAWPIEPQMLAPISDQGNAGFVPLCAAIQWIMTDGGKRDAKIDNSGDWNKSVRALWPLICDGQIEMIGLRAGHGTTAPLPGHALTLVNVLQPLRMSIGDMLVSAPSHIVCMSYIDHEHWHRSFNDQLFETGKAGPAWSHLQVRKSQLLQRWPRGTSTIGIEQACYRWLCREMQATPEKRPKPRTAFLADAKAQFEGLADRQFLRTWQRAIGDTGAKWSKSGRPKSNRSGN